MFDSTNIRKGFERIMIDDLKLKGYRADNVEILVDFECYNDDINVYVCYDGGYASIHPIEFRIVEMPGCCGYAVICDYVLGNKNADHSRMDKRMIEVVKMLEKTVACYNWPFAIIQTVKIGNHETIYNRNENKILTHALKERKWTLIHSGKNHKSKNKMFTWVKRVRSR